MNTLTDSLTTQTIDLSLYHQYDSIKTVHEKMLNFSLSDSSHYEKITQPDSTTYVTSILTPHQLQVTHFNYEITEKPYSPWIFYILLSVLILFTFSIIYNRKWIFDLSKAFLSERTMSLMNRETDITKDFFFIPLFINTYLCFTLFLLFIFQTFYPDIAKQQTDLQLYGMICVSVLVVFTIYILIRKYLKYLFLFNSENNNDIQYYLISIMLAAQIIYPTLFIYSIYQTKALLWIMIGVYTTLFLVRHLKCFISNLNQKAGLKYFLYLCIIEILPCLILLKYLQLVK